MRTSTSWRWGAALTYFVLGVAGQTSNQQGNVGWNPATSGGAGNDQGLVTFEPAQFNGNVGHAKAIFLPTGMGTPQTFSWTATARVVVTKIELWQYYHKGPMAGYNATKITNTTVWKLNHETGDTVVGGSSPTATPIITPRRKKLCDILRAQQSPGGGSVILDPAELGTCEGFSSRGFPLYFKAIWAGNGGSNSRVFTVIFNPADLSNAQEDSIYTDPTPYSSPPGSEGDDTGNDTPSSGTPGVDEALNPSSTNEPASSASRTGLELGAIIGIAVGCGLAGLLAVLGIIWFVVRRRQEKQDLRPIGSFNSDNRGDDLMAEKEAHTGVDVDASPNSPYSDDGHANSAYPPGTAVTAAAAAAAAVPSHQNQSRSYTPYSDRGAAAGTTLSIRTDSIAQHDEGARANVPSPIPGQATPRGLTTPYAHLVEEGMTEEEISRLEEEERQLDAAIEQAGRR